MDFFTTKPTYVTDRDKCHVSHVTADEVLPKVAETLEGMAEVVRYVKNQEPGFTIPYTISGTDRQYIPDFIAVIDDGHGPADSSDLIVEVTGERKRDKAEKVGTARELWVPAVNNHGGLRSLGVRRGERPVGDAGADPGAVPRRAWKPEEQTMKPTETSGGTRVESIRHYDTRTNIPTEELGAASQRRTRRPTIRCALPARSLADSATGLARQGRPERARLGSAGAADLHPWRRSTARLDRGPGSGRRPATRARRNLDPLATSLATGRRWSSTSTTSTGRTA
ncbi:MAG: hypothetical protein R2853_11170 [Thermomicrobiales bacterium]